AYVERRAVDLAAAQHDLSAAERQLADIDRKVQEPSERKARAVSRGRAKAARGDMPRIVAGGMKRAAENTTGMQSHLADRQREGATSALLEARTRIEILQPLAVTLESTDLPSGRTVLLIDNLTGGPGEEPIVRNLTLRTAGPERVALIGPNGSGKTTLLRLATGSIEP